MATTRTRMQPRIRRQMFGGQTTTPFGGGVEDQILIEAASQSFKVGDLVYIDGSGNVAIATVTGGGVLSSAILGIAANDATGVTGTKVRVYKITENELVEMNIWHATPASAVLARTLIGNVYGIEKQANIWSLDMETTGTVNGRVQVVEILDDIGDTYGRVLVRFTKWRVDADGANFLPNLQT